MREILFRGKRLDNGEWVEGNIIINHDFVAIMSYNGCQYWHDIIEVNSSTIGQYTGLTDKNGKLIFEGDILFLRDSAGGKHYDVVVAEYWNCSCCGGVFGFSTEYGDVNIDIRDHKCAEVIGNIHDNPELMEGN